MFATALLIAALSLTDVARMSRDEAAFGREVVATGVVTVATEWRTNSGVAADPENPNGRGVYFLGETQMLTSSRLEGSDSLKQGDIVEIRGRTACLSFAPGIKADVIRKIGEASLPPPPRTRLADLGWGAMDNTRVTLRGVLVKSVVAPHRAGETESGTALLLNTPDGRFVARVPGGPEPWTHAVDAELEISGCAMSLFNLRAEFLGVRLEAGDASDIKVAKNAPPSLFDIPETKLSEILSYSPTPYNGHAKKVRGTVTFVASDEVFFMQDEQRGIKVECSGKHEAKVGDAVEVAGFPVSIGGFGELHCAVCRTVGRKRPPEPVDVKMAHYSLWPVGRVDGGLRDFGWCRVRFIARVISATPARGGFDLLLSDDDRTCTAFLHGELPDAFADAKEMMPLASITAVAEISLAESTPLARLPEVSAVRFDICGPEDIKFVSDPEWQSRRRKSLLSDLLTILSFAALALAAAVVSRLVVSNRRRGKLEAIAAERKRMASDLHDSIEQNLTAARMLMRTSLRLSPETPQCVSEAVESAAEILDRAKAEIRETIFNLRSDDNFDKDAKTVFTEFAKRLSAHGLFRVRNMLRGIPQRIPAQLLTTILHLVEEAHTNAVKHGGARNFILVADPVPGGFTVRLLNDGEPFDAASAPGPESGHYGLVGMRERAKRAGVRIFWETRKRWNVFRIEVKT